jgi:hypothetical protein
MCPLEDAKMAPRRAALSRNHRRHLSPSHSRHHIIRRRLFLSSLLHFHLRRSYCQNSKFNNVVPCGRQRGGRTRPARAGVADEDLDVVVKNWMRRAAVV